MPGMKDTREIDGVTLHLAGPVEGEAEWIGREEVLNQLSACWLTVDEKDFPLSPRLTGPPGIGKTTLASKAAAARGLPLYIYQCTADTRPEDLLVTPVLAGDGKISYQASPLVTAMLVGGVCVLDEGNRMNEKSWASLAPLLDHRRYAESIVAGVRIPADADFRCAVTMNEDESTFEIPDYILSRLQPTLALGHPDAHEEKAILKYHLPFADEELLSLTVQFLQKAHGLKLDFGTRDGISVLRYVLKLRAADPDHPLGKHEQWRQALLHCLGEEALDLDRMASQKSDALGGSNIPMGLADFFMGPDSPLNGGDNPFESGGFDEFDEPDDDAEGEEWKDG